jgi:prevent-host-death family protein
MSIIPLAEAKAHLSDIVSRVSSQHERVTVTVHGRPSAILLAPEDLERLEETIAVLADNELLRHLADSDDDLAAGRVESADELTLAMAQRRSRR